MEIVKDKNRPDYLDLSINAICEQVKMALEPLNLPFLQVFTHDFLGSSVIVAWMRHALIN